MLIIACDDDHDDAFTQHNNSLESFALSQELTNELGTWTNLWSLNKIDSVDQWLEGQVHVTSRSMMNYKASLGIE